MALQPLFSSVRTEWETPPALFQRLDQEFSFTLDVCATRANRKCPTYFAARQDGLRQRWSGRCWMNPPYGRSIGRWIAKAVQESRRSATVVCLLPARTDTVWWHNGVMRACEIRLIKGRLTFVGAPSPAPFPSAIAIFTSQRPPTNTPRVIGWDWKAVTASDARLATTLVSQAPGRTGLERSTISDCLGP
jgi:phage N-6-adenine-methyltransferase